MKKLRLLLTGLTCSCAVLANAETLLYDFEDGVGTFGGEGWGQTVTSEANPYNCGNTSAKCVKIATEGYGVAGFSGNIDIVTKVVAVDVFSYTDAAIRCNSSYETDITQSVKAKVWTTLYFDFRKLVSAPATSICIGVSGETGVCYVDNIRLVDEVGTTYDCEALSNIAADLDYTFGRVQIGGGGFVSGLVSVPGKVKLARTDVGGAYKWDASNCEWKQLFDFVSKANIGLLSVEAMAVDPSNSDNMYFLCGCQYYSDQKTAVLYTKDGGATFKEAEVTNLPLYVHGNGNGRNAGERIAVDPNNGKIIMAGGRAGSPVIISTDGAATWKPLTSFPNVYTKSIKWPSWVDNLQGTTENENGVVAIVFDESAKLANGNTGRIFVGVSKSGDDNIFVTEDGGATWKAVTINNSLVPVRMKMDGAGDLIVTMADKCWGASSGAIYRYNVATGKVTDISPSKLACSDVAIKASNPNYMITSTNNTWVNQTWDDGKTANGDIIWVTKDGGASWTSLQDKMVLTNNGVTWVPGYALHWCGGICLDADDENKASFTSGNGIWTCDNIWEILDNPSAKPLVYFDVQGVEETVPLDMISIEGKAPMSVIGDYTGFVHESVAEYAPIYDPAPGTTYGIGYAAKNPDVIARVSASEYASQNSYITTNGGKTWTSMGDVAAYHVGFSADGKKMFICTKAGELKVSTDNGKTWGATSITSGASYVIGDPENSDYIYATTKVQKDGWIDITTFYVSADGGKTFKATCETDFNKYSRITVVPGREGMVLLPNPSKGVMVSTDYGTSFGHLGLVNCDGVGVGKGKSADSYTLYAFGNDGKSEGYFRSVDEGKTWQLTNDSKHNYGGLGNGQFIIGDMNVFGRFYVGTTGMGIVYADETANFEGPVYKCNSGNMSGVEDCVAEVPVGELEVFPNPTDENFSLNKNGHLVIVSLLGTLVYEGDYEAGAKIGANLPSGIYVVRLEGEVAKLVKK